MTTATLRADLKTLHAENPIAIAPRTLIVGKNGTGKSAITQAIEYALTASVTDHMGRAEVRQSALLRTLAPPERNLHAALELPDGPFVNGQPGLASELVFPLRAIRENLVASPEKGRQWLLSRMGVDADRVLAELATAKAHAKQAAADVAMLQERIATLGQNAQPVTDADRAALAQTTGFSPEELAALVAELQRLHGQASAALTAFQAMPMPAGDMTVIRGAHALVKSYAAAAAEAERYAALAGGSAPSNIDKTPIPAVTWGQIRTFWQKTADDYAPMLAQTLEREAAQAQAQALVSEYQQKLAAYNDAAAHPKPDVSALKARIDTWDTLVGLRQQLAQRLEAGTLAAATVKQLQAQLATLLQEAAERFNKAVSMHLGIPGAQFELVLSTPGAEGEEPKAALRWGLRRPDGRLDQALSGAEWMRVQLAMACALTPSTWTGPVFLLAEDRAWDPASLANAMRALTNAPERYWIVLTSTDLPMAPVEGWTIIGPDGGLRDVVVAKSAHVGADLDAAVDVVGQHVGLPGNTVFAVSGFDAHMQELAAGYMDSVLPPPPVLALEEGPLVELPPVAWIEDAPEAVGPEATTAAGPEAGETVPAPVYIEAPAPKKRGRPPGSKNKTSADGTTPKRGRGKAAKAVEETADAQEDADEDVTALAPEPSPAPAPASAAPAAGPDPRLAMVTAAFSAAFGAPAATLPVAAAPSLPPLPPALELPPGLAALPGLAPLPTLLPLP